jgi:AcrR family transcriptional regulator
VKQPGGSHTSKTTRTRRLVEDSAVELFAEGGYDTVTMADIARRANVSKATVFNHFATKDALIFSGLQHFERALVDAIRRRADDESIPQAFRRFVLAINGALSSTEPEAIWRLHTVAQIIESSPALQDREQQIFGHHTQRLADLIADETDHADALQAWVIANALMGVHRALVREVRTSMLAGSSTTQIVRHIRRYATLAFAQLDRGLAGHGVRLAGR